MPLFYHVTVFFHVLAALIWLGGMLALALLAPVLRASPDEAARQQLFQRLGERFRLVGWICIGVLVITGVGQLQVRGWWGMSVWGSSFFWSTPVGRTLAGKLGAVLFMLVVQAIHDFVHGPRAGRLTPGTPEARAMRTRAAWLARLSSVAGLVVVWFAVALARGG